MQNFIKRQLENIMDIFNNKVNDNRLYRGEILEYDSGNHTANCVIMPDGLETGHIQIGSPYTGTEVGAKFPFVKGQQVLLGCLDGEYIVLCGLFNPKDEIPPSREGSLDKYGNLSGDMIDNNNDVYLGDENTNFVINKDHGMVINTNKNINVSSPGHITHSSEKVKKYGNFLVNVDDIPKQNSEQPDLNDQLAVINSKIDSALMHVEKMGQMSQMLTNVVSMIGLNPISVINIFGVAPALKNNAFIELFTKIKMEFEAIQMFIYGVGDLIEDVNPNLNINNVKKTLNKGSNYINFDPVQYLNNKINKNTSMFVERLQLDKANQYINKATSTVRKFVSLFNRFYDLGKKIYERKTGSMIITKLTNVIIKSNPVGKETIRKGSAKGDAMEGEIT